MDYFKWISEYINDILINFFSTNWIVVHKFDDYGTRV